MDAMSHSPHMADILWKLVKLKRQKGTSETPDKSSESIFDKTWIKELEGLTPTQSWLHWMNENALRVEIGILFLALPKHIYSKIGDLTNSDSEYSYDLEDELDNLIQYNKEVESNLTKNSKSDQNSLPLLAIYATPEGRTVRLE